MLDPFAILSSPTTSGDSGRFLSQGTFPHWIEKMRMDLGLLNTYFHSVYHHQVAQDFATAACQGMHMYTFWHSQAPNLSQRWSSVTRPMWSQVVVTGLNWERPELSLNPTCSQSLWNKDIEAHTWYLTTQQRISMVPRTRSGFKNIEAYPTGRLWIGMPSGFCTNLARWTSHLLVEFCNAADAWSSRHSDAVAQQDAGCTASVFAFDSMELSEK